MCLSKGNLGNRIERLLLSRIYYACAFMKGAFEACDDQRKD